MEVNFRLSSLVALALTAGAGVAGADGDLTHWFAPVPATATGPAIDPNIG
ncbi:hypothetical protein [Phaeobacter piscinae]|nr:hypothetical protein [Phaeobacter piscinae]